MERSNYFSDQYVFSDDLNNEHFKMASQSVWRSQASLGNSGGYGKVYGWYTGSVISGGIYGSPNNYLTGSDFRPYPVDANNIRVLSPGKALMPTGELIDYTIDITSTLGTVNSYSSWPGTGSAVNKQNYVKLKYIEASGSMKTDDYGNSYPTRYYTNIYGGAFIQIDEILPTSDEILLATFMAGGSGEITSNFQDRRLYCRTITTADAVMLDPTYKPISSHYTAEDHIRAVGTGIATPTNPHGLGIQDMNIIGTNESFWYITGSGNLPLANRTQADLRFVNKDITGSVLLSGYGAISYYNNYHPSLIGFHFFQSVSGSAVYNQPFSSSSVTPGNIFVNDVVSIDSSYSFQSRFSLSEMVRAVFVTPGSYSLNTWYGKVNTSINTAYSVYISAQSSAMYYVGEYLAIYINNTPSDVGEILLNSLTFFNGSTWYSLNAIVPKGWYWKPAGFLTGYNSASCVVID